ncbi:MAG: carbohydrate binding domain-containing protein [Hymenobacter sp.]|nr:carbohydrate binding domain-containing protein [Hymenobacter sp.]
MLGLLSACSSGPGQGQWVGDYITTNDFESVLGWGADAVSLTLDHAHSGRHAVQVGPGHEYGLTYNLPLGQASVHQLTGVEMEAWVYVPSAQASGALALQIIDASNGKVTHAEYFTLTEQVQEYGEWRPVRKRFMLPTGLSNDLHLRMYLWRNNSPEAVYLDDLRVKALE